jgi:hypothetical protein
LCEAIGRYAYIVAGELNEGTNHEFLTYSNWAGDYPEGTVSRAPHIAYAKFGELVLLSGGINGDLVMTPVPENKESLGFMGGAGQNGVIVAVSKWEEEHDKLLALLTLYNTVHQPLALHHAGFRFPDKQSYDLKNATLQNGMERPAEDHERTYFNTGEYYRENQFYPGGPRDSACHWDLFCDDPKALLWFIARAYGIEPVFWEAGKNDPIGAVWIKAKRDGSMLGVMARYDWWKVEEG